MAVNLKVKLEGDNTNLNRKIKETDKEVKKLDKSAKKSAAGLKSIGRGVGIAFGIAALAIKSLIGIYKEQEQAEIRTRRTLEATGFAAGLTSKALFDMASALQEVTTFGDETIIAGQNLLLTFRKIGAETFPRATEAMLDMSTAMGTGLKESAIQLGKALNDPIAGMASLTRVGITFSAVQKNQIKEFQQNGELAKAQAVILTELEAQFGGAARAAAGGTGSLTQLWNVMGDIAEVAGGELFKALGSIAEALNLGDVAKFWLNWAKGADDASKGSNALKKDIAKLEVQINQYGKSMEKNADSAFAKFTGKYQEDVNKYADFTAEKIRLTKILTEVEKEEFKNSAEFKAKILADQQAAEQVAKDESIRLGQEKLAATKELNESLIETEKEKNERLKEESVFDVESNLEALQAQLDAEAQAKNTSKIQELIDKGKFEAADAAIETASIKRKQKRLKQELDDRKAFLNAAVSLASSENKALAVIGKAAALTQIAIQTPPAVASSFRFGASFGGPVGGFALAAVAATAMAAQAAKVAGISGFAEGGIIPDGDDRVVGVRKREMVLTEQDQDSLLGIIRGTEGTGDGGGGEVRIVIDAGMFTDAIEGEFVTRSRENRTAMQVG